MGINSTVSLNKNKITEIPKGPQIGLLLGIVHIGVQKLVWKGNTKYKDQAFLQFELQDVLKDDGNPIVMGVTVGNSFDERATLVTILKALGAKFDTSPDISSFIGKPLLLNMDDNKAKTHVVISGYSPLPKIMEKAVKPLMGTPRVYLEVDQLTESQIEELPEWVRKLIKERVKLDGDTPEMDTSSPEL